MDTATEELLHCLDNMRESLALMENIDQKQAVRLCEAAARTYAFEVLPAWMKEEWKKSEKKYIEGWRKLEQEFGVARLKGAFFLGEPGLDYHRLIERSKEIWKNTKQ